MNIPAEVRKKIVALVYAEADKYEYLLRTRPENSQFIIRLIKNAKIGGVLREYGNDGEVKTYIKDSILNHYSKARRAFPRDLSDILSTLYTRELNEISYNKTNNISLYRSENENFILAVARTTSMKWETGLRKLIIHVAGTPGLFTSENDIKMCLVIFQHGSDVSEADKKLVERALKFVNFSCLWVP